MSAGKQDAADFADIVSMSQGGLVSYLVSLKKIMGKKVDRKVIVGEMERLQEPFTRHLLDVMFSTIDPNEAKVLTRAKGRQIKAELAVKLKIVRSGCMALAAGDNPRKALARMRSHLDPMNIAAEQASQAAGKPAQALLEGSAEQKIESLPRLLDSGQHLLIKFLALNIVAKKSGMDALEAPAQSMGCSLCSEGILMAVDGYDSAFVGEYLDNRAEAILTGVDRKIEAGVETAAAVRTKAAYEEVFIIAKSYLS
jgi:hypothetical protein